MMTAEQLRASILLLAMQGKLLEQRSEEGTGEELYWQIQDAKERRQKKNKKTNNIIDEYAPFEIPDTWKWTRLGDIVEFRMGKTPPRAEDKYWKDEVPWFSISDMIDGKTVTETKEMVSIKAFEDRFNGQLSPKGTLIMSFKLTVGKVSILGVDAVHNEAIISIFPYVDSGFIMRDYLKTMLPFLSNYGESKKAIKGFTLNSTSLNNIPVPLPPLEEQKRIVAKIEELMPYVDQYAAVSTKLNNLNTSFPDMMKKSILQEAVQGKLVPQDPNDEPASELLKRIAEEKQRLIKEGKIKKQKALPEITEDEIPFDIPDSWEWARLNDCLDVRDGTHDSPKYHTEGYPLVTSKNLSSNGIDFSTCKLISKEDYEAINQRSKVDDGDILFAMIGTIGNPVIHHGETNFSIKNMALFKHIGNYLDMEYVYWFLLFAQSDMKNQAAGGVQSFVSLGFLRNYLIPVPPIGEQHRISQKLFELVGITRELEVKVK